MEIEQSIQEIYEIGFRNGAIEMKNKVQMKLNRDVTMFINKPSINSILDKISKMTLPKPKNPIQHHGEA